jgi:predicted ATP-dependent endonuclease of OLD family
MEIQDKENQFETAINLPDDKYFFVIVGGNNSGKTTILRSITKTFVSDSYRIDVNRTVIKGEGGYDRDYFRNVSIYENQYRAFDDDNGEKPLRVLQDFFALKDAQRVPIIDWYNKYFPNRIYEELTDVENRASPMLLKINTFPISKQGSGMRATLEIFIKLFDPKIKILCIDEPELGLEPYLQKYLFQALKDKAGPDKKIIIATHSHHFIDKDNPTNNFICERNPNGKIKLTQTQNNDDLRNVIFRLLGNTLSSIMLPEKVLILEGSSDTIFLGKILDLLNKKHYAIQNSDGNGSMSYAINSITQFLRFNQSQLPVYKNNIFVIVDKPTKDIITREWKTLLGDDTKIKVLSKNGIEYYYPENILQTIFSTTNSAGEIVDGYLASDPNVFNGLQITKFELAKKVANQLSISDLSGASNELFSFVNSLPL